MNIHINSIKNTLVFTVIITIISSLLFIAILNQENSNIEPNNHGVAIGREVSFSNYGSR